MMRETVPQQRLIGIPDNGLAQVHFWLGKTHPPAVHFPIALLTAAAVAELLRVVTGKPAFDAVSRYCIWFETLSAVTAGVLGWSAGEPDFRLEIHRRRERHALVVEEEM
jgi:uncharacterized membrane protein